MKQSAIAEHRRVLGIEENPELIFRVYFIFIGVILFGGSVCQPEQRAEELTILYIAS